MQPLHPRQITLNFTWREFSQSQKALELGIDNTPPDTLKRNLEWTAAGLERIRAALEFPITITSGYRSKELNEAIKGSVNSQHCKGEAVDFTCRDFGSPRNIALYLSQRIDILGIDQLIMEHSWVHCSFTTNPRGESLTLSKDGSYLKGIV